MKTTLEAIKGQLIVSCQALENEPLHSSFIMGRMAEAALQGGAKGIRANGIADIQEIKATVQLPIIGIIKNVYEQSKVFITPTESEVEDLYNEGVEIIAMDATARERPEGKTIDTFFPAIRKRYPNQLFMADCSSLEDGKKAYELGFDLIGTTLSGYTEQTKHVELPDLALIEAFVQELSVPIIAEGGIWTPEQLEKIYELGVHAAVVGSAITRPQMITERFAEVLKKEG